MRKKNSSKNAAKTTTCPECSGHEDSLAGHNSVDSVDRGNCCGSGKVVMPKIQAEETSQVVLNGKTLIKDKDYTIDSKAGIVLNTKIVNKIKRMKNYSFSTTYSKTVIKR